MFEKESEEYANRFWGNKESLDRACTIDNFKDGAEFGYNKGKAETALLSQHILDLQKDKGSLTDKVRELEQQIEKMQDKLKSDLIARLKEKMSYSTSPSCTKGMELFIKSIEKWEIKEND